MLQNICLPRHCFQGRRNLHQPLSAPASPGPTWLKARDPHWLKRRLRCRITSLSCTQVSRNKITFSAPPAAAAVQQQHESPCADYSCHQHAYFKGQEESTLSSAPQRKAEARCWELPFSKLLANSVWIKPALTAALWGQRGLHNAQVHSHHRTPDALIAFIS